MSIFGFSRRRAQRNVQHRPALGDIDGSTPEHCIDPFAQPALIGKPHQELNRLAGDAILRVIEVDPGGVECKALAARRILREEVA